LFGTCCTVDEDVSGAPPKVPIEERAINEYEKAVLVLNERVIAGDPTIVQHHITTGRSTDDARATSM
jgi:hypothetical protein